MSGKSKTILIVVSIIIVLLATLFIIFRKKIINMVKEWIIPVKGKITSNYGTRINPINGESGNYHNGIDIAANQGTEIKAPRAGTVDNIYFNTTGGNQITITHNNGYRTGYAHIKSGSIKVKKGDIVNQGDVIAEVGNTGMSTGPHLHFVIHKNGSPVDPVTVIPELQTLA